MEINCPYCARLNYVGSPGEHVCPKCQTTYQVSDEHEVKMLKVKSKYKIYILFNLLIMPIAFLGIFIFFYVKKYNAIETNELLMFFGVLFIFHPLLILIRELYSSSFIHRGILTIFLYKAYFINQNLKKYDLETRAYFYSSVFIVWIGISLFVVGFFIS